MARTIPPHTRIPAWHALALGVRFVVGYPRGSLPRPGPGAVLTVCESVRKISATEHATAIIKRRLTVICTTVELDVFVCSDRRFAN